jgi:CBS domain-containing protein
MSNDGPRITSATANAVTATKDPSCCIPSDSAQRAASIMRDEHAGIVPVIEDAQSRRIAGVVTDRDLCMNVVAEGLDPSANEGRELQGIVALAVVARAHLKTAQTHEPLQKVSAPTEEPSKPRAQSKKAA